MNRYKKNIALLTIIMLLGGFAFNPVPEVAQAGSPSAPEYVGGADRDGTTNSGPLSAASTQGFNTVSVAGNYAFAFMTASTSPCTGTAGSSNGCEIKVFDISNPASPTYVAGGDSSGSTNAGTQNRDVTDAIIAGNYAYVFPSSNPTACSQTPGSAVGCELQVWDISTPSAPAYVGGGDSTGATNSGVSTDDGTGSLEGFYISGEYLFVGKKSLSAVCSQTPGSAGGCEFQVWHIGVTQEPPAPPTPVRTMRLFEGFTIKFYNGRIILYGS